MLQQLSCKFICFPICCWGLNRSQCYNKYILDKLSQQNSFSSLGVDDRRYLRLCSEKQEVFLKTENILDSNGCMEWIWLLFIWNWWQLVFPQTFPKVLFVLFFFSSVGNTALLPWSLTPHYQSENLHCSSSLISKFTSTKKEIFSSSFHTDSEQQIVSGFNLYNMSQQSSLN